MLYSRRDPAMHGVAGRPSGAPGEARCCGGADEAAVMRGVGRAMKRRAPLVDNLDGEAKLCVGGLWRE